MDGGFEWLSLLVRWIHVIAGVAWIGASFYFNWLEGNLERDDKPKGLAGDLWAVHGGGFYHVLKLAGAPEKLPTHLHWFKFEAYLTWLSGCGLLALVYYWQPSAFLLDPTKSGLDGPSGVLLGVTSLVVGWVAYHSLCKSRLQGFPRLLTLVLVGLLFAAGVGLDQVLASRAAYIHLGAMIGTMMAGNVFFVIIPAQKRLVAAAKDNAPPPSNDLARHAGLRSLHNNYLTLPLLFIMISNHYPLTFGHRYGMAILLALALFGVLVRHYFNLKNQRRHKVWIIPVALALFLAIAFLADRFQNQATSGDQPMADATRADAIVSDLEAAAIIQARCRSCHARVPTDDTFTTAPNGVFFDTFADVLAKKQQIKVRAVISESMPLGNKTAMTPAERHILGRWLDQKR